MIYSRSTASPNSVPAATGLRSMGWAVILQLVYRDQQGRRRWETFTAARRSGAEAVSH
jgi:hypothetical protein